MKQMIDRLPPRSPVGFPPDLGFGLAQNAFGPAIHHKHGEIRQHRPHRDRQRPRRMQRQQQSQIQHGMTGSIHSLKFIRLNSFAQVSGLALWAIALGRLSPSSENNRIESFCKKSVMLRQPPTIIKIIGLGKQGRDRGGQTAGVLARRGHNGKGWLLKQQNCVSIWILQFTAETTVVYLAHIFVYPIKSLDGVALAQATVLPSGALQGDREFAIVDEQGRLVNGKRTPAMHQIRAHFALDQRCVSLRQQGDTAGTEFHLDRDRDGIARWLSVYFGFPVQLVQNQTQGYPDDSVSPGPTVISTATLKTLTTWFPGLNLENLRQRFRSNLELGDSEPFWEDRLYGPDPQHPVAFHIGAVPFLGINPCQRCIVPTRTPNTGDTYPHFQRLFASQRQQSLPAWVNPAQFNHFYRLAVNTQVSPPAIARTIHVGDVVSVAPAT